MKLDIVKLADPSDPYGKNQRPAIVIGRVMHRGEFWAIVAPCTTYSLRTGFVPPGSVLLSHTSPAFAATGFLVQETDIQIKSVFMFREYRMTSQGVKIDGYLDLGMDKVLAQNFETIMHEHRDLFCNLDRLPVAF